MQILRIVGELSQIAPDYIGKISNKSGEGINYRPTKIKKIQYSREVKKNVPA